MNEQDRQYYKEMLGCTDEQLDKLLEVYHNGVILGYPVSFGAFVHIIKDERQAINDKLDMFGIDLTPRV